MAKIRIIISKDQDIRHNEAYTKICIQKSTLTPQLSTLILSTALIAD